MKLIIAGSREFNDYQLLIDTLKEHNLNVNTVTKVVSGCAHGADKLGERWAVSQCIPIARFPADWDSYGKRAGYVRNGEMAEYADACIVFWNGSSKGTKHMIDIAKRKKDMRLIVVTVTDVKFVNSLTI
jgi:hypothetical protein